ncbi:MaoC/PaaZ C-terminal domain-containing protein [Gordonia crocea]|uniref:Dehydratase n=1 Tax=Gordonia crocea TaxID=589162 RepID=A0A7I9V237_9ACTN|nr:MaoC/PaaZ C-terminal domain-containing protein [Gordonia crocea]GED99266.1 dehydratase [Gordonia crocea]
MGKVITLDAVPSNLDLYARAAGALLPVVGKSGPARADAPVPDTVYRLTLGPAELNRVQEYCRTTGMQLGDTLPLTYPFVLQFPLVMKLMTSREFPFGAVGSVHALNRIRRFRPISVNEHLTISTQAGNLREHRKGLLIDVTSTFEVGGELVYEQVGTFLSQQRTSLSGEPSGPVPKEGTPPPPDAVLSVNLGQIRNYASASGDRNPIHMGNLPAKAFGFPRAIAHGMWSAAAAVANVERQLPDAVEYQVRFGKPILLPAKVNLYTKPAGGRGDYDISLLDRKKGFPHLTGSTRQIS